MSDNGNNQRWFREKDAANVGGYTVLVYETWIGERNDPATEILEYMSGFNEEDLPDEYSTAIDQSNVPPYVPAGKSSYRLAGGYFDGLKDALFDQMLRKAQEGDWEAERHRQQSQKLLDDAQSEDTYRYGRHDGELYEKFLAAIDRVGSDENDDEAWAIIDQWRQRQLRAEERDSTL